MATPTTAQHSIRATQTLALWAEWLWSCGVRLGDTDMQSRVAQLYFEELRRHYPSAGARRALGMMEIQKDLRVMWRKLSYGGRRPESVPAVRRDYVNNHAAIRALQSHLG